MTTREAILESARTLVQQRGTNGMSYDDISRQVGIRKASIHYHFPSKNDLLAELVSEYTEAFLEAVDAAMDSEPSGEAKLRGFIGVFASTLEQSDGASVCLCGMMASELNTLDEASIEGVRHFYKLSIERLERILQAGLSDGSLALPPALSPAEAADFIFSSLEGALLTARLQGGAERFRSLAQNLIRFLKSSS